TWLLASVADEQGRRVLLIDTDTQGNLTSSFRPEPDGRPGVEALFHPHSPADAQSLIRATAFPTIDLIPGGPALAPFDLSPPGAGVPAAVPRHAPGALRVTSI